MKDAATAVAVDNRTLRTWRKLSRWPGGRTVFSIFFSRIAPFNAVISPRVLEVRPGLARVAMKERRRLHQHLGSVHAGALFTLAEATSGLTLSASVPDGMRIIVTNISIDFVKKAHGCLVAVGECEIPEPGIEQDIQVHVSITDEALDTVATATISWLVGKKMGS